MCFRLGSELGSGQFGTIHKGEWRKEGDSSSVEMAVMSLNCDASEEDGVKFLQEAAVMAQFKHPNMVALHGVVERNGTVSTCYFSFL